MTEIEIVRLQADCAYQARMLKTLRDKLVLIDTEKEDEGGRVYFASTNDADELHVVVEGLDDWDWERIIPSLELPDLYATLRALRQALAGLNAHVEAMQARVTAFLVPEPYKDRDGCVWSDGDPEPFASDMIYMLDGPEQRAAQNAARAMLAA